MSNTTNQPQADCPLCETATEAVKMLNKNTSAQNNEQPKSKSRRGSIFIFFAVAIIAALIIAYLLAKFSGAENKSIQGDSIETPEKTEKIAPQINALAPDFITADIAGQKVALSDFRNQKPVLLIFWATWCGYCAKEKEDLKTFTQKYQDKIQILAVDSGEPKQTIADYIQKNNINFLILLDEQRKIWNQYLIRGTPSHFLIGKDGRIITLRPGVAALADLEMMLTMVK